MSTTCSHACDLALLFQPAYKNCCICRQAALLCDRCAKRWERSTPLQKWKVTRRRTKDHPPLPTDEPDQDLFYKHCRRPPCNHPGELNCNECDSYIDNPPTEALDGLVDHLGRVP